MITRRTLLGAAGSMVAAGKRSKRRHAVGWGQNVFPLVIVVGSNAGVFVYDGAGNLVDSVAFKTGVDPLTKSNKRGIVSQVTGVDFVQLDAGSIAFGSLEALTRLTSPAGIGLQEQLSDAGQQALLISSPGTQPTPTNVGIATITLLGESKDASKPPQVLITPFAPGVPAPATAALLEVAGTLAAARLDVTPAGVAPPARPAGSEPWNLMTTPLQNAWANSGGTDEPARYRLIASPPNSVEIGGVITHAAIAGSSQFFTLPAAYTPSGTGRVACNLVVATAGWAPNATWPPRIAIDTVGNLTAIDLPAGTTKISFHGIFPLD